MKEFLNKAASILKKREPVLFLVFAIVNILPFFSRQFYPFMDAPAHLYNTKVINEMVFAHNSFYSEYFAFNAVIVPNWFSHLLMPLFHSFLSPSAVEKAFFVCYYLSFPLAFRYCIRCMNGNVLVSYFSFPLAYHTLMLFSFYNFSFGLVFMLLGIGYFFRNIIHHEPSYRHFFWVLVILTLTYLCHLVPLLVLVLAMFIMYVNAQFATPGNFFRKFFSLKMVFIILSALPAMILLVIYLQKFHSASTGYNYLDKAELLEYLLRGRNLSAFGTMENFVSGLIAMTIHSLFFVALYFFFTNFKKDRSQIHKISIALMLVAAIFLYGNLPDADGVGGFVSMRFCVIIFMFVILFISCFEYNKLFLGSILSIMLITQYHRTGVYNEMIKNENNLVSLARDQSKYVESNSFMFFFKEDDDWLTGHYQNYLCLDRSVIPLQDYETSVGYFPLVFKDRDAIFKMVANLYAFQDLDYVKKETKNRPVYLWVTGNIDKPEERLQNLKNNLQKHAVLLNSNNFASLYKLR